MIVTSVHSRIVFRRVYNLLLMLLLSTTRHANEFSITSLLSEFNEKEKKLLISRLDSKWVNSANWPINDSQFLVSINSIDFLIKMCLFFVFFFISQLSFSPTTPGWSHFRLVALLSTILILSGFMFIVCVGVGFFGGLNTFAFMAAEVSFTLDFIFCILIVTHGTLSRCMWFYILSFLIDR